MPESDPKLTVRFTQHRFSNSLSTNQHGIYLFQGENYSAIRAVRGEGGAATQPRDHATGRVVSELGTRQFLVSQQRQCVDGCFLELQCQAK